MKVFWEHDVFASQTNSLWYKRASCVSPIIDVSASDPLAPLLQAAVLSGRGLASIKVFPRLGHENLQSPNPVACPQGKIKN